MSQTLATDKLLTVKEVAERLKVDEHTVYYWMQQKIITHIALPITKRPMYRVWNSTLEKLAETPGK